MMKLPFSLEGVIQNLSNVKLKGGVVGKVTLAVIVVSLCFVMIAWSARNVWISGAALALLFLLAFPMLWRLISFADRHPQAALLEGAQFLVHEQLQLGSKAQPVITVDPSDRMQPEAIVGESAIPELAAQPDARAEPLENGGGELMATLYHVYLKPKNSVSSAQIEQKLNLALDWFKYGENCWIVESTSDTAKWQTRLKPLVDPDGHFFICQIDPNVRQGWMSKKFWEWLRSKS